MSLRGSEQDPTALDQLQRCAPESSRYSSDQIKQHLTLHTSAYLMHNVRSK